MLTGVMAAFEGIVARFVSSSGAFGQKLAAVGPGQWNWATPCTEWNVRQLVNHMTQGNLNYIRLLDGGDRRGVPTNERRRCPGSGSAQRLRPVGTGECTAAFSITCSTEWADDPTRPWERTDTEPLHSCASDLSPSWRLWKAGCHRARDP